MTTIELTDAAIGSGLAAALPALTLTIAAGEVTVVPVETDERPMVLSLLLGGRLAQTAGAVTPAASERRDHVALVDTPFTSEPSPGVTLSVVVAEELSFARRASGRRAVRAFLESHGLAEYASVPMRSLPSTARVLLLCELAAQRPGVDVLVVTSPERHGGDPAEWLPALQALARRGLAVAIITDSATSRLLKAAS